MMTECASLISRYDSLRRIAGKICATVAGKIGSGNMGKESDGCVRKDVCDQIRSMLSIDRDNKTFINGYVMSHNEMDVILRHDLIHYCLMQEQFPTRYDDESEFDYKTRLLYMRRRLESQNRLAGCIAAMLKQRNG